ncbi:hypothetical protein L3C95_11170 [Chitinophaga filiformis]|uniref:hypothetical protein n=1 Tax=Chitinophaga filiformis TaxID=104663 RepID=UPI001F1BA376|nr:hypothetical protein [Chitinophaga filiformis]MCF6402642.1 hypothetical protein [Chitinophaga filiformis]MCF6403440.1 hypothetical protein [Chitinophaga filiformis]
MVKPYLRNCCYRFISLLTLFIISQTVTVHAEDSDHVKAPLPAATVLATSMMESRSFPDIDKQLVAEALIAPETGLFTDAGLQRMFDVDSNTHAFRDIARAEFEKIEKSNRYTSSISPDDLNELPMGLFKTVGNTTVTIAVSNAIFHPTYAELTVYAKVQIPQEPREIFFGLKGLKLSYKGGILGDAKLVLLGDVPIRLGGGTAALVLKGGMDMQTGQGLDLTYVTIDCNGFKELGLSADLAFPRSMLVPLNSNGERTTDSSQVKASFNTVVRDWNDILVSVDLPAFEITPLKGVGFRIGKAVYDGSDLRNSPDVVYPANYQRYLPADDPNLWRGVYVSSLEITLPKQFERANQAGKRVSFGGKSMLIDNNGISGNFFGNNILNDGSAAGWHFTVDRLEIDVEANHLTGAAFNGMLGLPMAKVPLGYSAVITADNEYILKLNTIDTLDFSVWRAKAQLNPNSWVQLKLSKGHFEPEAMLNGSLILSSSLKAGDNGKPVAKFKGIVFQNLHLQTKAPYLTADYFGYKDENTVCNFPVAIKEISLETKDSTTANLNIELRFNLMEGKFGGDTRLALVGKFDNNKGLQTWKFEKVKLDSISLRAELSEAMSISGLLKIYDDDAVYGDAISGEVNASFMKGKIKVRTRAMFGAKTFRYWYVDGKAEFKPGIAIAPPMKISGFGGGAYYRMKKEGIDTIASPTGVKYLPDSTAGLGLKAAVLFDMVEDKVVHGEVSFEVAFNRSGGINFMGLYGYAKILATVPLGNISKKVTEQFAKFQAQEQKAIAKLGSAGQKLEELKVSDPSSAAALLSGDENLSAEVGVTAYVGIQYDFTTSTLHGNFDMYMNVANGMMTGNASGNRAGWAVIHISPSEWYLHMGTPTNRLGTKLSIGGLNIKSGAYLMVGDKIPGSPPPPQEVADILGVDIEELDYMRDANALGEGRGFAFGASLTVETGDITFLILYANFKAGLGFDIMLKDYGDAHCVGSTEKIGIDGWYANGQAYVYLQGELGVKVNLKFIKARVPLISGAAAMLMQAKLPNPTWVRGYMAVKFSVLGGLVKGNMRMKVVIGQECEIVMNGNSPVDVKIISDVKPSANADAVDVFTAPQAAFNMRMGQQFDVDDDNGTKTYRARLASFTVMDNGQPIAGRLEWNANNDGVSFYSKEVLPSQKQLTATVKVTFEERVGVTWQTAYVDGKPGEEIETVTFTTGTAPDYIPMQNIAYSYPVVNQQYYYKDESDKGLINLSMGQAYLFDAKWQYAINFKDAAGQTTKLDMTYDAPSQTIHFTPTGLKANTAYQFDVIAIPPGAQSTDEVVAYQQQQDVGEDGSYTVANNQAQTVSRGDVAKSLLHYGFRTSKFNTFAEKMQSLRLKDGIGETVSTDVVRLLADVGDYEGFEVVEMTGNNYTGYKPMVNVEAVMDDAYFTSDINPLLYANYPINNEIFIKKRNTDEFGVAPSKAFILMPTYLAEASTGKVTSWIKTRLPYLYNLPDVYNLDFVELQNKVVNRFMGTEDAPKYAYLINGHFPFIRYGAYKVKYQYVLPDGTKTSSAVFNYHNPFKTTGF